MTQLQALFAHAQCTSGQRPQHAQSVRPCTTYCMLGVELTLTDVIETQWQGGMRARCPIQ
jgi:hypothetical protein